ncbi:uncharacterized protein EV420DRAFT_1648571 [Desarmillaria tabescens]|uniref:Uncharacterized protein n=1 Tax=Armillaria tabescens TaxID=1929756 RepID=A0AA39MS38_ARMTA|nr:uncharacterized protein EV420DRAFT_1648571 [Desarmillaria tabescens]KAK0445051.1 hypothetical protein EV420DRAFT_1648571 [Desarmillaria tabescens]
MVDTEDQEDTLPTSVNQPSSRAHRRPPESSMPGNLRQGYPTTIPSVNPASTTGLAHVPSSSYNSSTVRTPDMMPLLGARSAPAKFTGKYDTVKRFIRQYKQMCAVYNVPDNEKCQRIIDYCSTRVTRFVEALDSFVKEDWTQLEKDILTYYDAELNESRYLVSDLDTLTDRWRSKGIYNLKRFKQYEIEFLTKANWLLHKGKITRDEQHTKFCESDDESDDDEIREKTRKRRKEQDNHWKEKLEEKDEVEELIGLLSSLEDGLGHRGHRSSSNSENRSYISTTTAS